MFGVNRNKALDDQRRLEQAHDEAMEALYSYWLEKYWDQQDTNPMYWVDDNGDEYLCPEAQDVFNDNYNP